VVAALDSVVYTVQAVASTWILMIRDSKIPVYMYSQLVAE